MGLFQYIIKRGFKYILLRLYDEIISPRYPIIKSIKRFFFVNNRQIKISSNNKTLYYFLDLQVTPITFDVISYMTYAEVFRRKGNFTNIYVIIVPGYRSGFKLELPDFDEVYNSSDKLKRLNNIISPSINMFNSCIGYKKYSNRKDVLELFKNNYNSVFPPDYHPYIPTIPIFNHTYLRDNNFTEIKNLFKCNYNSNEIVRNYIKKHFNNKKIIVITIRNSLYSKARNSDIPSWIKFSKNIENHKYGFIFLPDVDTFTENEKVCNEDIHVWHEAAKDVNLRLSLYKKAYLNMGVSTGPFELCWYNYKCNYMIFFKLNSSEFMTEKVLNKLGIRVNENFCFANKNQLLIWDKDNFENIQNAFNNFKLESA